MSAISVRGGATPEELAAVVAAMLAASGPDEEDPARPTAPVDNYRRWRAGRLAALRRAETGRRG